MTVDIKGIDGNQPVRRSSLLGRTLSWIGSLVGVLLVGALILAAMISDPSRAGHPDRQ